MAASTQQTTAAIARRRSRLSRLKLTYPHQAHPRTDDKPLARTPHPHQPAARPLAAAAPKTAPRKRDLMGTERKASTMPVLDPDLSAALATMQSLDDAIAFRLGRLDQPCPDCVPQRRCVVHSYDERLAERYQARYAAAFSHALARLDPDAVVQVMQPGVRSATALLATTILTRLQETAADSAVVTEMEP